MADLVEAAQFVDRSEALIARALLQSEGLLAVLPDLETLGVAPHYVFAIGGFRLLVHEDQLELARAILRDAQSGASAAPE